MIITGFSLSDEIMIGFLYQRARHYMWDRKCYVGKTNF